MVPRGLRPLALLTILLGTVPARADGNPSTTLAGKIEVASILAACTGGVTGGGSGVLVRRDGGIFRWRLSTARARPEETFVRTEPAVAARLFARLDEIGFGKINYSRPSNITCALARSDASGTHEVAWRVRDAEAPAAVLAVHAEIGALVPADR